MSVDIIASVGKINWYTHNDEQVTRRLSTARSLHLYDTSMTYLDSRYVIYSDKVEAPPLNFNLLKAIKPWK